MRKVRIFAIGLVIVSMTSCFQNTCPTYTKKPANMMELEKEKDNNQTIASDRASV